MLQANSKWKGLHESSKDRLQSPQSFPNRFRSDSKANGLDVTQKSVTSITKLLNSPQEKLRTSKSPQNIEYYQVKNKKEDEKTAQQLKDPAILKKELARISENRPLDRRIIDSAISTINAYEQEIKQLKEQLAHKNRKYVKKQSQIDEIMVSNVSIIKNSPGKDLFASTKTIQSISSFQRPTSTISTQPPKYFFPRNSPK